MAISFPLSLDDFYHSFPKSSTSFQLDDAFNISGETAGGQVLRASRGYPLWGGRVSVADGKVASWQNGRLDRDAFLARFGLLRRPAASFMIGDEFKRFPKADPTGSLLAGASPVVSAVSPDRREITITSLPPGYVISPADHMSISFDGGRIGYFRVVVGDRASPGLSTHLARVEVDPWVPLALGTGDPVTLIDPSMKAIVVPGSIGGGETFPSGTVGPLSFSWKQTLGR